jgi:hypothetical protein
MAQRPVFAPVQSAQPSLGKPRVRVLEPEFQWHAGFALVQQQKSIASLHQAARRAGVRAPLEISSKSPEELGRRLSAFNLLVEHPTAGRVPLESAFQAAKVFTRGGPYAELATQNPRDAKGDPRLRSSGLLLGFQWGERRLPARPTTAFYDWLYMQALGLLEPETREQITRRDGFTDIAFNPDKSINCQARSAALFVSLAADGYPEPWTFPFEEFVKVAYGEDAK